MIITSHKKCWFFKNSLQEGLWMCLVGDSHRKSSIICIVWRRLMVWDCLLRFCLCHDMSWHVSLPPLLFRVLTGCIVSDLRVHELQKEDLLLEHIVGQIPASLPARLLQKTLRIQLFYGILFFKSNMQTVETLKMHFHTLFKLKAQQQPSCLGSRNHGSQQFPLWKNNHLIIKFQLI